ncbi:MAG: periplasmic heavy metal sensor [Mariniphaga sp.]|nr:periplasmic heavy metal sensor [Mariniphaga sp.]MDD4425280.1 periplasmic heavy metal sensor [Mariniphaga sp.]
MEVHHKYRILTWIVVILVATNLSMAISFLYHKQQDKKQLEQVEQEGVEMPAQQRTRFFREQLNLTPQQVDVFRELNRDFNRVAWQINRRLESLRVEMINELGREIPEEKGLDTIATEIGELHEQLKKETINYYLAMKKVCDEDQQKRLNELFLSVLHKDEDVRLPQRGRRFRSNR